MSVRIAYVPGAYDMFHIGHLNILRAARSIGELVIAGVVTDKALSVIKGYPPVIPFSERAEIVRGIRHVDEVVSDHSASKLDAWERIGFDGLVKGDDWRGTAKGDLLEAEMRAVGVTVFYFPYTPIRSTTGLRKSLASTANGARTDQSIAVGWESAR